jgi:hypothetical protein
MNEKATNAPAAFLPRRADYFHHHGKKSIVSLDAGPIDDTSFEPEPTAGGQDGP